MTLRLKPPLIAPHTVSRKPDPVPWPCYRRPRSAVTNPAVDHQLRPRSHGHRSIGIVYTPLEFTQIAEHYIQQGRDHERMARRIRERLMK